MANLLHGGSIANGAQPADVYALIDTGTVSNIVAADIATGGVSNANLAQITTAGKVTGAALSALASVPSGAGVIPVANLPEYSTLPEQSSAPTTAASTGAIYTKDSGTQTELYFREESDGDEIQITSNGEVGTTTSASDFVAKAWVVFDGTGSNPITKGAGYNIDSTITKNGTGDYTIAWDTDFADTNYVVIGTLGDTANTGCTMTIETKLAGSVRVNTYDASNVKTDNSSVNIVAFGAQ